MAESSLAKDLHRVFPALPLRENEPMKAHCSFRIGGPAEVFVEPRNEAELRDLRRYLRAVGAQMTVIGNGTNLLVRDEGVRGVVIHLGECFATVDRVDCGLRAAAGVTLAHLATTARDLGLAGLEFAHGIPGSLGGAVLMNAGAYGAEMKDVVASVRFMDGDGEIRETTEPDFSYRHSRFADSGELILGAVLHLSPDDPAAIHARMMELWARRSASQPLDRPSAGSTFKRPAAGYAAAMIDAAGLRGVTVGGAQVSEKHTGFIINTGNATFSDVTALMTQIQKTVYDETGVLLEPEVRII